MAGKTAGRRGRKPGWQQDIARERILILFGLADGGFGKHPERSRRYVQLARRIGMRYNVKIPENLKGSFCKNCNSYLKPGVNCRVRASAGQRAVIMKCLECGKITRRPYRREKAARRRGNPTQAAAGRQEGVACQQITEK